MTKHRHKRKTVISTPKNEQTTNDKRQIQPNQQPTNNKFNQSEQPDNDNSTSNTNDQTPATTGLTLENKQHYVRASKQLKKQNKRNGPHVHFCSLFFCVQHL
eukprot:m.216053 g.216053  ORF g.216053 m.216053 type:complete len:102 (+) comp33202_c5_seq5:235-540(+)